MLLESLCLPKTLSGMTRGWAYGNEAADGHISDTAAACYPVAVHTSSAAWGRESHPAPTAGSSTAQVPDARETVEHRSLAAGMAVSTVPVAPGRDHRRAAGDSDPLAPMRFPRLLALEVPPRRRPSKD